MKEKANKYLILGVVFLAIGITMLMRTLPLLNKER